MSGSRFQMMRKYLVLILIYSLFSCKNTKFQKKQYCKVCWQQEDLVLLDIQIPNLLVREEEKFYSIIKKQFAKYPDIRLELLEDWDYEMIAKNIKVHETEKLHQVLDIKYLLKLELKSYRASDGFDMLEPDKANSIYPTPRVPLNSTSVVAMTLVETETGQDVFVLDLLTRSQELSKSGSDGSEYFLDGGSVYGTMKTGSKRGSKYLLADCSCPKGKYIKWSKILQGL
jgi:hypothetical protein